MRIAFFTPLEPVRSGISAYSAELLPRLAAEHELDIIVSEEVWQHWADRAPEPRPLVTQGAAAPWRTHPLRRAHDFLPRHLTRPYDLIVYQLGNATCHEFMWPYLFRYPGLIVLHDGQLHHARAYALLRRQRQADYRAEFAYAQPDTPPEVAEFIVAGLQGPAYYLWPFIGPAVRRARAVAVHNPRLAADLRGIYPDAAIETVRMGVSPVPTPAPRDPQAPITFAAFGLVTPEKRIPQMLRALAAVAPGANVRLRLIGGAVPHYDALADAAALGISHLVSLTGFVSDDELDAELAACDACLNLRWPTSRETSASWIRCLAAGKPTIVNDLADLVDVPTIDPRTWSVLDARAEADAVGPPRPLADAVAISIDVLDEDHSLELAMRRLAADAGLRAQLGRSARAHWAAHHTLDLMTADYTRVLALAASRPAPDAAAIGLPAHLLEDHSGHARRLAADCGITLEW